MQILKDTEGIEHVAVEDLRRFLQAVEDRIQDECAGAPDGCTETRAYLYGEICAIRTLRRAVERWKADAEPTKDA